MQNKIQDYGDDSIQIYAPLEAIRKKVDLYIGRSDNGATALVVKEIIANSIDEYFAGFGDKIEIVLNEKENSITVRDYGRGIPPGKIDSCFTQLHSSGKFEKKEGSSYGASSGTHGLGIKAVSALGKTSAKIFRDGVQYSNSYTWESKGVLQKEKTKEANGTLIIWIPDSEPFHGDNKLNYNDIKDMIEDLSYITPKMKFYLKKNNEKEEIISSKGIKDFLDSSLTTQDLVSPILSFLHQDDYIMVEGALVWTKNKQIERSYANAVLTQSGGTHITAFKTTLTRELNKFLNSDLKGEEIRRNLSYIINIKTIEELSFSSQSKDSLSTPALNAPLNQIYRENIVLLLEKNKTFFEKLEKAIQTSRKKSNTQALLRELTTQKPKGMLRELSDKYKGCSDNFNIELFLAEGDSAAGNLNPTKNHKNQAVFALKGKPYNSFSQDLDKVLKNTEIKNLIGILGTEQQALKKFDKIILAADADNDGIAIVNLLLGFFVTFYKELIIQGRIYIPELPKYLAVDPKGENHFFYADESLDAVPKSWHITYFKGLGEMSAAQLGRFTTNTKTRKLIQIKTDEDGFEELYTSLQLALSKDKEDVDNRRELLL